MNRTKSTIRVAPALLAFTLAPGLSTGQVVGTQCWNANGVLQCNSQAGILYTPPSGADAFAQNFVQAFVQARALRRLREQEAELENEAQLARQRQAAAEAAAADREAAAKRLFLERVTAVIQHLADSLRIFGEEGRRLLEASGPSIVDLYKVNPLPTRDQIMEVLWPFLQKLNSEVDCLHGAGCAAEQARGGQPRIASRRTAVAYPSSLARHAGCVHAQT